MALQVWGKINVSVCGWTIKVSVQMWNFPPLPTSSPPARRQRGRLSRPARHIPPHHYPSTQGPTPRLSPSELQDENYHRNPHPSTHQTYPTHTPSAYGQPPTAGGGAAGLEEPRAFHPPTLSPRLLHPAAHHHHHHHHHQQQHHVTQQQQGAMVMDLHEQVSLQIIYVRDSQETLCVCVWACVRLHINCGVFSPQLQQASVPVSYTVTPVPPHGLAGPLCSGQHLPPTCSSQQQVPACSVVFSTGQHYHPVRRTQQYAVCGLVC